MKMTPFLLAFALSAAGAPAAAAPTSTAVTAPAGVDPARFQKAFALVQALQPAAETVRSGMALMDQQFVPGMLRDPDVKKLESEHPGIVAAMWSGGRPIIEASFAAGFPDLQRREAELYARELTPEEMDGIGAFLLGPIGKKFAALAVKNVDFSTVMKNGLADRKTTSGDVVQMMESTGAKGIAALSEEERQAFAAFAESPGGRALARIGPKLAEESARWMNMDDPVLERKLTAAMQQAAENFMKSEGRKGRI